MKIKITMALILFFNVVSYAQTNIFPGSGSTGVGTVTPEQKFEIYHDATVYMQINGGSSINSTTGLLFKNGAGLYGAGLQSYKGDMRLNVGSLSHPKDAMIILPSGNIGIGTSNPIERFHLSSADPFTPTSSIFGGAGSMMNQGAEPAYVLSQDMGSTGHQTGYETAIGGMGFIYINGSDFNNLRIGTQSNHNVILRSNNQDRMTITNGGNIGIGTSNANELLTVNGKIRSKEVKVDANNWPDYVFEKNYPLMDIENVERYITEKGHLPEVPSAEVVNKEGVNLSEINSLLLKKIEELTLYVIGLNKEIVTLKSSLELIQKR